MTGLVKYQLQQYFKSTKFVMPAAVLLILLESIYSMKPLEIVSTMILSGSLIFLVMTWVGVTTSDLENPASEYILILRAGSEVRYAVSHILFVGLLSLLYSGIAVAVPLLQQLANGPSYFTRVLTVWDVLFGGLILLLCAFAGAALGELANPRILRDRKVTIMGVFLTAVFAIAKGAVLAQWAFAKWILWIVPPVAELGMLFAGQDGFSGSSVLIAAGIFLLSIAWMTGLKLILLNKNGF